MEAIISNPFEFEQKKEKLKAAGAKSLHIVADFDRTLTKYFVNGKKIMSLVALLREHKYLTPEYAPGAFALFDKYHPFEEDLSLPIEERRAKMVEWWSEHVKWMAKSGMDKATVEKFVREQDLHAREGLDVFLKELHTKNIPLFIFSASITDFIEGFLRKKNWLYPNTHIISNKYQFDNAGKVTGYQDVIVHSLNKGEIAIKDKPYFKHIHQRKNVILLGDNLGDLDMINDMEYDAVIKICFLNEDVEKHLPEYKEHYDVIIPNDGRMDFINKLIAEIKGSQ